MKTIVDYRFYLYGIPLIFVFLPALNCKITSNNSKPKPQHVDNIQGFLLKNIAAKLSHDFNRTVEEELGVSFIHDLYSNFKYTSISQDFDGTVAKISSRIETKLNETFSVLNGIHKLIENYYNNNNASLQSALTPCALDDGILAENDDNDETNANLERTVKIQQLLRKAIAKTKKIKGNLKHVYFLSNFDVSNESNASVNKCNRQDQSLLWSNYINYMKPTSPRNVMLLLDHGGSLSGQQFQIVKDIAMQMISVLNNNDNVGLIALSDDCQSPHLTGKCTDQLLPMSDNYLLSPATKYNKNILYNFINILSKGNGGTNHSLGFQKALQAIQNSNISTNDTIMLLYVSRGLLTSIAHAKPVLETIVRGLEQISNDVIINTCVVIDESKPVLFETQFLRDIAEQNYTQYKVKGILGEPLRGIMLSVHTGQMIGLTVARFYNTLQSALLGDSLSIYSFGTVSLPRWDPISKDLSISIAIPCGARQEIGLLGADLYLSSLVEDITYFSIDLKYSYAFIIDSTGKAIMHPSYPRPLTVFGPSRFVDIQHLEKIPKFSTVRNLLLTNKSGSHVLIAQSRKPVKYYWHKVGNWYTVCIVVHENETPPERPYKVHWFPSSAAKSQLLHYRLDILPASKMCLHLKQIATLDAGTLYLSASCFKSPFAYAAHSLTTPSAVATVTPLSLQTCMAYLKDNTRLMSNPGLREHVRDDVAAQAHVLDFMRALHRHGLRALYIVRRYVASASGVLQMYPGGLIAAGFEPTRRTWFVRAIEHRHRIVLTAPYLDAGGAGYIVTVAYATDHVVVGMDVTLGYVYKMLRDNMPFCGANNIKCFLIDDRGYLIYHPNLIDPNGHGPIEQQHIIHKESFVASDILNHNHFVQKRLCNNYADGTIQRYYRLNTSIDQVLVNAIHEHCLHYQLTPIAGTNVFIGVVNATCELSATFCPCSVVDRLCMNCNGMEQLICECPCECPLSLNDGTNESSSCPASNITFSANPLCETENAQSFRNPSLYPQQRQPHQTAAIAADLKPCIPVVCEEQKTYETCLGVLGCEWCQYDVNGEPLRPFCTSLLSCFNGILGSQSPYADLATREANSDGNASVNGYSPIGPIVGSVLGMCLILVVLFLCHRSYAAANNAGVDGFYLTAAHENQVRMSDLNISDDYHHHGGVDGHRDRLLQDRRKQQPEVISPYCVSTGYRRQAAPAADSDHGYSTMTPHDESERLSFAPFEIDAAGRNEGEDECSDATSIRTSPAIIQPSQQGKCRPRGRVWLPGATVLGGDDGQTKLPPVGRNCVIAPVTVHRNMETAQL